MKKQRLLFLAVALTCAIAALRLPDGSRAAEPDWSDPAGLSSPPAGAPGYPSRAADLDVFPGFQRPPAGYGEVPFWWWTGDPLDEKRLLWQIEELHRKGIPGMQVNYAHEDSPGWPTYPADPEIFSEPWWKMWRFVAEECRKRDMGVGLSGYTLDWPGKASNLFGRLIYTDPELNGQSLVVAQRVEAEEGKTVRIDLPADLMAIRAYRRRGTSLEPGGIDLNSSAAGGRLEWTPPGGTWQVWAFATTRSPLTLNPMHPQSGRRVIEKFFQPFEDHAGGSSRGLDYFFQDELGFGVSGLIWVNDLASEFSRRKGYDLLEALPALFEDMGPITPKVRMDYADVKVRLTEERYFRPIFDWHWKRGMIYACDPGSRGQNPEEFGDYFRCVRWYTAPGHDTPGGSADLIKDKVSSSIAHLYRRPRVWLEGYHSLGWGATPATILRATRENFLYGCTLLNLHGLYYTTHGSYWEWAPPCYHFRMPYWDHLDSFLRYFERLSYLLSQGVHRSEVAILYPVAPFDADMGGGEATAMAFGAGRRLMAEGIDFDFIDFESLARAEARDGRLEVAGESYRVLVLPAMRAVRWSSLVKARELFHAGGIVVAAGALPEASDRAGREDPELDALVGELFGATAVEVKAGARPQARKSTAGGIAVASLAGGSRGRRRYPGGYEGRFVWSKEPASDVQFKAVWPGQSPGGDPCRIKLLCDNAGSLHVNGRQLCKSADHTTGWTGEALLKPLDVITIDAHDDDKGDRSAGLFLAVVRDGKTVLSAEDLRYTILRQDGPSWRTDADVTRLSVPSIDNVHEAHRGDPATPASAVDEILSLVERDVEAAPPCTALHRKVGPRDVYMVMGAAKGSWVTFRAAGRVELWDPWTGRATPLYVAERRSGTTAVRMPLESYEASVIVFSPGEPDLEVEATDLDEVTQVEALGGTVKVSGHAETPGRKSARVRVKGQVVAVTGEAPRQPLPLVLDGPWEFELKPTLDNRWGDFRLPASEAKIGPEARVFRHMEERSPDPGWEAPGFDDSSWHRETCGFGPKFWKLGPLPEGPDAEAADARLAPMKSVDPSAPVEIGGKSYHWQPYAFSWRWGVEGDPGHQGWHGLKENITDDFICLGTRNGGLNEILYGAEPAGRRYYLWTAAVVREDTTAAAASGGNRPAAVYVNGARMDRPDARLALKAGANPLLLRFDAPGRGHFVLERAGAPAPGSRTPLAMSWYDRPGVVPFDPLAGESKPAGWFRFVAPPGLCAMTITALGSLEAWVDGEPCRVERRGDAGRGSASYRVSVDRPKAGPAHVALRIEEERGSCWGAALPEPIALDCGPGLMALGDWSAGSALECYSGGAWYRKTVALTEEEVRGRVLLDLGDVAATAEVHVNGRPAGTRVAAPWTVDITALAKAGENRLEILVYNTLSNHYLTIPTNYRGSPRSGLIGPVRVLTRSPAVLTGSLAR